MGGRGPGAPVDPAALTQSATTPATPVAVDAEVATATSAQAAATPAPLVVAVPAEAATATSAQAAATLAPVVVAVPDAPAMAALAADLAALLSPGDRVGLIGDLGAGKTTLARALIRARLGLPDLDVPSPTFTLVQDYPGIRHVDLYRLADDAEARELGLGEDDAIELIEWPRQALPITVAIAFAGGGRSVTVAGPPRIVEPLARRVAIRKFLAAAGWGEATRRPLAGDASARRYERLERFPETRARSSDDTSLQTRIDENAGSRMTESGHSERALAHGADRAVLMDAPAYVTAPDSYSARARRADGNPAAFLAVGAVLRAAGLSAPQTFAADPAAGLVLMEDLGDAFAAEGGVPVPERYLATAEALAAFHRVPLPATLPGPPAHTPPRFDADLSTAELAQFPRFVLSREPPAEFVALWRAAIDALPRDDDRLALRDVQSPNILWLPERQGIARAGLIDYQDAMIAPSAFDVVSLAQDPRVDVPAALEAAVVAAYLAARPEADRPAFRTAYAVIGAQRATRIVGAFHRLATEGKPQYLPHIARVTARLARNLRGDPALADLAAWYARETTVMEAA